MVNDCDTYAGLRLRWGAPRKATDNKYGPHTIGDGTGFAPFVSAPCLRLPAKATRRQSA